MLRRERMKTDETSYDDRIALQPETSLEQQILAETFVRLKALSNAPPHPNYLGTELCFYTLDVDMYDTLDHDLWNEADIRVDQNGKIDPDPGSRALVIIHDVTAVEERADVAETALEQPVENPTIPEDASDLEPADDGDVEDAVDDVDDELQGDEDDVFTVNDICHTLEETLQQDDPGYDDLQHCAKMLQDIGFDIPANQAAADLEADIEAAFSELTSEA